MFSKFKEFLKDANFNWKDAILLVFIAFAVVLLTEHVTSHICVVEIR